MTPPRTHADVYTARHLLRFPPALKAHLQDAAGRHKRSLNEEIVYRLLGRPGLRREVHRQLLALEPGPEDTRSVDQIIAEIEYLQGSLRW